jgi:PII-like signaling protein
VVDTDEKIQEVLPLMDGMIAGGLVTLEKAHVVLYRAGSNQGDPGDH